MKDEIKVGEYVRTTGGHIRKVSKIMPCYENDLLLSDTYYIEFDEKGDIGTYKSNQAKEFIVKHSKNLIDLIQCGDYVNGLIIDKVEDNKEPKLIWHLSVYGDEDVPYRNEEIKDIVTKESFSNAEYKVEDD